VSPKYKVLYTGRVGKQIWDIIRSQLPENFELLTLETNNRKELLTKLKDADFVFGLLTDSEMVTAARKLKLVQLQGVGYDKLDLVSLKKAGIPVAQTPEGTIVGVAEHTILMILALFKKLIPIHQSLREGKWLNWELRPDCFFLHGKTLGIVGLGRIGREVVKRARAFEAHIVYYDTFRPDREVEEKLGVEYLLFDELLSTSDIVTLHTPLTPETRKLIGRRELGLMKPWSILINTSRGEVVDENALYEFLKERKIAAAGLDVFDPEPPKADNPILQLENVILSPHVATGTRDAFIQKSKAAFANMQRVLRGEEPKNVIPFPT